MINYASYYLGLFVGSAATLFIVLVVIKEWIG